MGDPVKRDGWKTGLAVLLLIVSLLTALFVLQVTGLWEWINPLTRRAAAWPVLQPHVEMYRLGREEWRIADMQRRELELIELDLDARARRLDEEARQLARDRNELQLEQNRLTEWEARLEQEQAALQEARDEIASLEQLRELYSSMRPQEAAVILLDMDEAEISRLLADMPPRQAGAILALLPSDKAIAVSRALGL